ncbi:hypothetical protein TBLA_0I03180 [Henningerozyma blattae CBS 6284]|uniref:dihydroorotase n=1 Tax=Henningerozyma blattae (strain ATCC 34711 / CBS 6284 / DSM 70876 / NBRC 10599 / NRRL Y-10934 / UCD 77-7) TaxID=1071380 RepID=I2H9C1_HENB6|nr:hypothetical protein TBLA_0I03180 [Tetrapisispora blattae CBS 6284]CCH62973.1 hypothetical protein TBLA_0I03180 [Tetrapisispora blattae CBS 6284]
MTEEIFLGQPCDMHVHLRDGEMCEIVTPTVQQGGISTAYVMPNLTPPITTVEQARRYYHKLQDISPSTQFLMSLYLNTESTPDLVRSAKESGFIYGFKLYPAGVTTNSSQGIDLSNPDGLKTLYPTFKAMEEEGLVLNLHGEIPSDAKGTVNIMTAEPLFLPQLRVLHATFPKLKIILEHCTTKKAVELINELNSSTKDSKSVTVAGSITAHHLWLTMDDWAGCPLNFCKPVAKTETDRIALIEAATSGKPWFFLGSDSAPHPTNPSKLGPHKIAAGVFTQPYVLAYVASIFEKVQKLDILKTFVTDSGREFYGVPESKSNKNVKNVYLLKDEQNIKIAKSFTNERENIEVIPFRSEEPVNWIVQWK